MKVLFVGGGTMGSVSPLVGIYEELKEKDPDLKVLWLGTKSGPEREFLANYQIPFKIIISGKVRQYFSLANFFTPLWVVLGFIQALFILMTFRPKVILTAGSFVAVPVSYAAWFWGIPRFVHQQDIEIGKANKLMAKMATAITVTFGDSLSYFDIKKTFHIGNPVRKDIFSGNSQRGLEFFKLNPNLKTILIMGGGTGAQIINQMVLETISQLTANFQVIHLTGKGKGITQNFSDYFDRETNNRISERYRAYEFLNQELFDAYTLADLVVCRSGFSTLTELAVLAKPALVIPLPGHQELNAQYFAKYNAVKILNQENLNPQAFSEAILYLMNNPGELITLSRNISQLIDKEAGKRYVDLIYKVVGK
ncbi:MAG: UDP-N-acetylglucosamine--N-acetylmuramyl-(pentapeptide) pyrophosphoryl-undecaprenol N-acetylglucosamine transferase [Candidatus Parcubacteria bacterium]|nr:UDP-N-acetylglucosamine--N-acetylmuramyl-(pentapeptide) pyrophosphoryl-undecaprenol N-acetylglucosamine transferase [Candidatus Parcubacteria bacterium]